MNFLKIVADLKRERDRLSQAIALLESGTSPKSIGRAAATGSNGRRRRRSGLTAAGRKRLSEAMKRRWAERRRKG